MVPYLYRFIVFRRFWLKICNQNFRVSFSILEIQRIKLFSNAFQCGWIFYETIILKTLSSWKKRTTKCDPRRKKSSKSFLKTKMCVYTDVIDLLGQLSIVEIAHNHVEICYFIFRYKKSLASCNSFVELAMLQKFSCVHNFIFTLEVDKDFSSIQSKALRLE